MLWLGVIISKLNDQPENITNNLTRKLMLSKNKSALCVKLDAGVWWERRFDLWNGGSGKTGYNSATKIMYGQLNAIRNEIGWLNWGRQIRNGSLS